jgi:copper oxidase (laccase) domain-containing protein
MSGAILFEKKFPEGIFRVYDGDPVGLTLAQVKKQVHGKRIVNATMNLDSIEADGLWCPWEAHKNLGVRTADCLPILVLGEKGAALLHAGWRGLAAGILAAPEVAGLVPKAFFVGPCIHACCFKVTAEFTDHFPGSPIETRLDGTLRFDLVAEAQRQVFHTHRLVLTDSGQCTCCLTQYSSFRRDKTTRRIWNCFLPLAK